LIAQLVFFIVLIVVGFLFFKKAKEIYQNIKLGRSTTVNNAGGFKNMILLALGQKKMCLFLNSFGDGFKGIYNFIISFIEVLSVFALIATSNARNEWLA